MNLKSFGCSFIFGTDLADDGRGGRYATASKHSWPALIAKHKNYAYTCYARPGSGNLRILEQVINQSTISEDQIFIIGWSWIDRFDYVDYTNDQWISLMPVSDTKTADYYYRNLHSQYRDKLTTLLYIRQAIDILQARQIPFLMTYMDNLIFETEWHTSAAILDLQEYVKPHLTTFDGSNFLDWSRENGFEISDTKHPLEAAHKAASEYILNTSGSL